MKTSQAIIGLLVMAIIIGGLFMFPNYGAENEKQSISVYHGQEKSLGELEVPIIGMGTSNVGTLHIELVYDPEVLRFNAVGKGSLTGDATVSHSAEIPGRVILGMVDTEGINGQGSLAVITFNVLEEADVTSSLLLENVKVWDTLNISKIYPTRMEGSFRTSDQSLAPPILVFPQ